MVKRVVKYRLCGEMDKALAYYESVVGAKPYVYLLCAKHACCHYCMLDPLRISYVSKEHCIVCTSIELLAAASSKEGAELVSE
jgi:hypothetical protein